MKNRDRLTITLRHDLLKQLDDYISRGKARNRSHGIEKILTKRFGENVIRRAVILGGGVGMQVKGYDHLTSPLLVMHRGRFLFEHHIKKLRGIGVEEVILAVGDFGEDVRNALGDGSAYGVKLIYFTDRFGTASTLRQAQSMLSETFVMFNGHIIVEEIDFVDILLSHRNHGAQATLCLTTIADPTGYGQIVMRGNNIVNYIEKPDRVVSHMINAGIYIVEPGVCDLVASEEKSLEHDIFPSLATDGQLAGYMMDVSWQRIKDMH